MRQSINLELGNNNEIIIVMTLLFLRHVVCYYVTLLLNRELVSRAILCLVSAFSDSLLLKTVLRLVSE